MSNMQPGWYQQQDGSQRYWDGRSWLDAAPMPSAGQSFVPTTKAKKPFFKRKRVLLPAGFVGLCIVGTAILSTGGGESSADAASSSSVSSAKSGSAKSDSSKGDKKQAAHLGSAVRDGKFEFVVTDIKCGIPTVGSQYLNKKAQGTFCRASLNISNIGDEAQSMDASNQYAFDAQGHKFSADDEASIYDENSKVIFEEINPGNTVKGRVYFDVPAGTKVTKLELHDSAFSDGVDVGI